MKQRHSFKKHKSYGHKSYGKKSRGKTRTRSSYSVRRGGTRM